MDLIRDKADHQARRFEHAPEDVVMAVQFARTPVTQVREPSRAGFDGLAQNVGRGVRVAEADFDATRNSQLDRLQCAGSLR